MGAFFELYLHELLCSMGFEIQVHPNLTGDHTTHPDFLALKDGQPCFYLEATLAGPSAEDMGEKARIDQVYDTLNDMQSPNFFLAIRTRGAPATQPSGKGLRQELEQWVAALDPDEIGHQLASQGFDSPPSFPWSRDGWDLEFMPIPKPIAIRGSPGVRPIGITMPEMKSINHPSIEKAVRAKATKYGKLEFPFVVAVNVSDPFRFLQNLETIRRHTSDELFGREVGIEILRGDGTIDRQRARDGAWYGPNGPQNTRVCAALIVAGLDPWTVGDRTPMLIHNPWASQPFPSDQWQLPQWVFSFNDGSLNGRAGKSAADVLLLPSPWLPPDDSMTFTFLTDSP